MHLKLWLSVLGLTVFPVHCSFAQEATCPLALCETPQESHTGSRHLIRIPSIDDLESTQWVQEKILCYPELRWLLDAGVQHTQEGTSQSFEYSWSRRLEGHHYPEFERTMLSFAVLYLILDGSKEAYERFTSFQPESAKLSLESFTKLHEFARNVVGTDSQQLHVMEINLLLGDMGKTRIAREEAKEYGITEPDHDLFLEACLEKCPQLFPSYMKLPPEIREKIKYVSGLVHFGHVAHVEGGPEILNKLKKSKILEHDPQLFDLEILTHICDVSAARGHEDNRGSKVLTEHTYQTLMAIQDLTKFLADHDEREALQHYLLKRAQWLGLDETSPDTIILAKFGAMMRLFTQEEGKALKRGYQKLSHEEKLKIYEEFDPLVYRNEKTPTYVPAVFVNFVDSLLKHGVNKEQALVFCLSKAGTFIADCLKKFRARGVTLEKTISFNQVAGQVRDNPDLLLNKKPKFKINEQGIIELY